MDAHIDMNTEIQEILVRRGEDLVFRAVCQGDMSAMKKLRDRNKDIAQEALNKCARENKIRREGVLFGQRQVESLLCFMISDDTERQLTSAVGDNIIYDGLGEHRILGKSKKKKKKMPRGY